MISEDSDDSDIFVVHQCKPVLNLTKRDGLLIKNEVLRQAKLDFQGNVVLLGQEQEKQKKDIVTPPRKRKFISNESPDSKRLSTHKSQNISTQIVNSPKQSLKVSPGKSPNKCITDYFSPSKKKEDIAKKLVGNYLSHRDIAVNPDVLLKKIDIEKYHNEPTSIIDIDSTSSDEGEEDCAPPSTKKDDIKVSPGKKTTIIPEVDTKSKPECITLSPGIRKNKKKFKSLIGIVGPTKKGAETVKKKLFSVPHFTTESSENTYQEFKPSTSLALEQIQTRTDSETLENESDRLDADILKFIIQNVMELQIYFKVTTLEAKKEFGDLLTDTEMNILEKYTFLDRDCQTLFMRMFFRKEGWHRVSTVVNQYQDFSENIEGVLKVLENIQYVKRNINEEDIRIQLGLLKGNELSSLSKSFSVGNSNLRKDDLLNAILTETRTQKSVLDLFKPTSTLRRLEMISEEAQKFLGPCFKIDAECRKAVNRIILLFSVFHEVESESKRAQNHRFLIYQVLVGNIAFLTYAIIPNVIFFNRNDLIEYENALFSHDKMELALKSKDHIEFTTTARESKWCFQSLANNNGYCERVLSLPTFLRRYNAGAVYAKILTMYCEFFKKKTPVSEVVEILKMLLGQMVFNYGSRGKWIELLCQSYQSLKMVEEAAILLITTIEEDKLDEVKKYSLIIRGQALSKAKKNRIPNESIRFKLESLCVHNIQEPPSIEICAQALSGNPMGSKLVYVQNTAKGKCYSSVEEQAISYYKKHGYTEGIHMEGFIVSTIFYMFFFDIIYAPIPGVFQSPFQDRPLDMWSSSFYTNRKELIDARLEEIAHWCPETIYECLGNVYVEYRDICSVIVWKDSITPQLLCEIIECIGIPAILAICKRFAYTPRIARSGFPDLTLWNKTTKKAKFVEVKSPNDRLAPNQRMWLQYLINAGVDCEVCNVRNIGSKFQ